MPAKLSDSERDEDAQIVALFSVLIHARRTGDVDEAKRARTALERLGVEVHVSGGPERRGGSDGT
ncbi:MAG: hypothetical protein DWQ34_16945 [Planctomycetota bacterium]|nr:MAG: hypothetical protein DWQ34_16945 [Planctomycetota bacterium]